MIERGDFVSPTFNYEPRLNKPILSYWIVGGFYRLFGISVGVQRLAIAVGAMGILAAAYFLGVSRLAGCACSRRPSHRSRSVGGDRTGSRAAAPHAGPAHLHRHLHLPLHVSDAVVLRRVGALPGSPSSVPPFDVRLHRPWNADEGSRRRRRARARIRDLPSACIGSSDASAR